MIKELSLRVLPFVAANEQQLKLYLSKEQGIPLTEIRAVRVLKRSIDARQRTVYIQMKIRLFINEEDEQNLFESIIYPDVTNRKEAIVVGAGPAGLFAALRLIELGFKPILLERGKNVHERRKDIALISREHIVNSESNYSFGEGGAGAFSDGKLYTRSKKRGSTDRILQIFCQFGASPAILTDAHPHIGTDKLPAVIENIRKQIIASGGEVHFGTRADALILQNDEVTGIKTSTGTIYSGPVILATGHSARDVYRMLQQQNIYQEAKGIAVGIRLEHPQALIDQIIYHSEKGRGAYLPAAEYSMVTQSNGRGVYSFCMCPGGFVVPAASSNEQVVVNGMSPSNRGSRWANSGMVVEIHPDDFPQYASYKELALMYFQEELEQQCKKEGGMRQTAPSQRMSDFITGTTSYSLPQSSYSPGIVCSPLHQWLPPFVSKRLQEGLKTFGKQYRGFNTNEAILIGVETRTSAPVRILRDKETLMHIETKGLFPCGEGAGYAGGIVSAAIDGERCAESLSSIYQ
ncbi:MAG: NAD(P)/FAD-dependent oxidoreductase [Bacteroidales bacterium]|nr:NAD(P)/FAD-dependent oxidoreductase [Bacteroidales bacterium]